MLLYINNIYLTLNKLLSKRQVYSLFCLTCFIMTRIAPLIALHISSVLSSKMKPW